MVMGTLHLQQLAEHFLHTRLAYNQPAVLLQCQQAQSPQVLEQFD
jgi:hypothetical protein